MKTKLPALTQGHPLQGHTPGDDPAQAFHDKQMASLPGG
jgi:hypothetical protein